MTSRSWTTRRLVQRRGLDSRCSAHRKRRFLGVHFERFSTVDYLPQHKARGAKARNVRTRMSHSVSTRALRASLLRALAWGFLVWTVCLRASTRHSVTVTTAAVSIPSELAPPVPALWPTSSRPTTSTTNLGSVVKSLALRVGASGTPSWADVPAAARACYVGCHLVRYSRLHGRRASTLSALRSTANGDHLASRPPRVFPRPVPPMIDLALSL